MGGEIKTIKYIKIIIILFISIGGKDEFLEMNCSLMDRLA